MAEIARQKTLNRGRTITQRFRMLQRSLLRPFALVPPALPPNSTVDRVRSNGYPYEATGVGGVSNASFDNGHLTANLDNTAANFNGVPNHNQVHHRDTSLTSRHRPHATIRQPTYLLRAMESDTNSLGTNGHQADLLSLPFRLSISHFHSATKRQVPYLRQSWTRIDFLAIISFWITFGLATAGFEHGTGGLHIGVFRALSVIRIARLLSVTSGTTVSSYISSF